MRAAHPQADAYLKARAAAESDNYELAAIGNRALERVVNGNWEAAMADMEKEKQEWLNEHTWD